MLFLAFLLVMTAIAVLSFGAGYAFGVRERRTDEEWREIMSYEHLQAGEDAPRASHDEITAMLTDRPES